MGDGGAPRTAPCARGARGKADRQALERLCFRNLLATPGERVFFKDLESRFLLVSDSFLLDQAHSCDIEEVIGKSDFDFFSDEHALAAFEDEQRIIHTGEPIVAKIERETFRDRDDAWVSTTKMPLRDDEGRIVGTFGISRDVTAQVLAEQALAHQALHDPVTGLANRLALMDRLSQALVSLDRSHGRVGLSSSTSTTSKSSTTRSVTKPVTGCSSRSVAACPGSPGAVTPWPVSAGTSLYCCAAPCRTTTTSA